MYKFLFNTNGKYVAYIYKGIYCFSPINEYIGFFIRTKLYDYKGNYLGTLTSDDRVIKKIGENVRKTIPIVKPIKPFLPNSPLSRYKMSVLPSGYIDIFIDGVQSLNLQHLDSKYDKFINCNIYSVNNVFLGKINFNKYDNDSIANKYGKYGNEYMKDSIFNKYGQYGSEYAIESPFNQYSHTPPVIKNKNGIIIAVLTANKHLMVNTERIDAIEFFNWFKFKLNKSL